MAVFDYENARKTASDDQIARFLSDKVGFDYDGALSAGASSTDIIKNMFETGRVIQAEPEQEKPTGILGALSSGTKQAGSSLRTAFNVATGDDADVLESSANSQIIPTTEAQDAFRQSIAERKEAGDDTIWGAIKNVVGAAVENPKGALQETVAQLPNSAVAMGSMGAGALAGSAFGPIGTIAGGIIGALFGNIALETGGVAQEQASRGEYDRDTALRQGAVKGGIIGAVDAATMGATGLMFKPAFNAARKAGQAAITQALIEKGIDPLDDLAVKAALDTIPGLSSDIAKIGTKATLDAMPKGLRSAALNTTAFGLETAGEGIGEYAGSSAAGLDASLTDAAMESLMSMPQSGGQVVIGKSLAKGKDILSNVTPSQGILNAQTPDEAIGAFESEMDGILSSLPDMSNQQTPIPFNISESDLEAQAMEADIQRQIRSTRPAESVPARPATPQEINQARIGMTEDIGREIEDVPEVRSGYGAEQAKLDTERDILLQKLDQMQNEVNGSRTRGVTQETINQPEAIAFPADSPEWMREVQEARKKDGKSALGRADLNTLFDKVRSGKPLTENQQDQFNYVQRAAQRYAGPAGEMVAQEEADDLEKRGFDLLGGRKMAAGNLNQGDKVIATIDGVKDEFEVKDTNENGEVLLQDGVAKRVDMFDEISFEAHKPADQPVQPNEMVEKEETPAKNTSWPKIPERIQQAYSDRASARFVLDAFRKQGSAGNGEVAKTQAKFDNADAIIREFEKPEVKPEVKAQPVEVPDVEIKGDYPNWLINEIRKEVKDDNLVNSVKHGYLDEVKSRGENSLRSLGYLEDILLGQSKYKGKPLWQIKEAFEKSKQPTTTPNNSNQLPDVPEADFGEMVKEAARWKGAAMKIAGRLSLDKKAALRHSQKTTKGDLDKYLMGKFGLDEADARSVSNELTSKNIPADISASIDDFKTEPWAQGWDESGQTKEEINTAVGDFFKDDDKPDITTPSGKPFTSKGNAIFALKRAKADKTHEPVKVEGGWVGRGIGTKFQTASKENENLAIVHNLSEDNLKHSLKMGGLPVPSVAVIDVEKSNFDGFGEITLVASKENLGPGKKENKFFNADVYSPRYPTVNYFLTPKSKGNLLNYLKGISEKIPKGQEDYLGSPYSFVSDLEREGVRKKMQYGNSLLHYGFLSEIGKLPKGIDSSWKSKETLRKKVESVGDKKYKEWVDQKIQEFNLVEEEKIFDGFTYSGNQKYLKHDLDTVVRLLKKSLKDGEGFNYGVPSIRAAGATQFKTVKQIQNNRGKIISSEDMEKIKNEANSEFDELFQEVQPYLKYKRGFGDMDNFSEHIKEAIETRNFNRVFGDKSEYYDEGVDVGAIRDFVTKLTNLPTEYFEGKIQRAVGINEFEAAVVPDTVSKETLLRLKDMGLDVVKYKKGDQKDRAEKIKSISSKRGLRFQALPPAPESGSIGTVQKPADRLKALFQSKKEKTNGRTLAQKRTSPERDGRDGKTDIEESAREKFQRLFGKLDKSGKTRLIAPLRKDLRQLQKVVELFGKKAYFFTTDAENLKGTNGFTNPKGGNEIFINARATEPLISIAGHELIHQLKNDHKDLYEFLLNTIRVSDSNFKKYVENLNKNREEFQKVTDVDAQYEEFIGDFAADNFPKVEFWSRMLEQNAPLTKRIIKVLENILNKIKSYFSRTERYISNADESMDALAYAMGEAMRRAKEISDKIGTDKTNPDIRYQVMDKDRINTFKKWVKENLPGFKGDLGKLKYGYDTARTGMEAFYLSDDSTFKDWAVYNNIDMLAPGKKIRKAIEERSGAIPEHIDAIQKEMLRISKTAKDQKIADEKYFTPIRRLIALSRKTVKEVDEYLYARHAPEANARLRLTNARLQLKKLIQLREDSEINQEVKAARADFKIARARLLTTEKGTPEHKAAIEQAKTAKEALDQTKAQNVGSGLEREMAVIDAMFEKDPFGTRQELYLALLERELKNPLNEQEENFKARWDAFKKKPSGMTDKEAAEINEKYKDNKIFQKIAVIFDRMNQDKLDILRASGRISKQEYAGLKSTFQYYAPLHREGYDSRPGRGRGISAIGKDFKTRGGSTKRAVDILAHAFADYEASLIKTHKTEVARAFLQMVRNYPNENVWQIETVKKIPGYDDSGNLVEHTDMKERDNEIKVKIDGKVYSIVANNIHSERLIKALKNDTLNTGVFVQGLARLNRVLAMVNTSLSPEFMVTNFLRDFQTAMVNVSDTEVAKYRKQVIKDIPKAMKGMHSLWRGDKSHDWAKVADQFEKAGGKISWMDFEGDIKTRVKNLEKEINLYRDGHVTQKAFSKLAKVVEDYNGIVENAVRLSVFKAGVDSGMTESKAALLAKDLTVNFQQKGVYGQLLNSLYLFANAGIQGSAKIVSVLYRSPKARKIVGASMLAATALSMANRGIGGDDDDGIPYYDKVDDFVKERNIIFMRPGGKYFKIPLPWGYNAFWTVGTEFGDMFSKKNYDLTDSLGNIMSSISGAFNPLQSSTILQTMAPTIMDPFVQVGENKTWSGSPLMPENSPFASPPKPDSELYWASASKPSVWLAAQLNSIFGNKVKSSGVLDISPETLDLVWDTFTGSAGRFIADTAGLPFKMADGELTPETTPFARRVLGKKSEYSDTTLYRENIDKVFERVEEIEVYPENKRLKEDRIYTLNNAAKQSEKRISKFNKLLKKATTDEQKKRYKELINKERMNFNSRYYKLITEGKK